MSNQKQVKVTGGPRVGLRSLLALHRTLGLISAFFVIVLSLTGLALQHSSRFDFDSRFLRSQAWLSWYGIEVPDISKSFVNGSNSISLISDALYFDATLVIEGVPDIKGFVTQENGHVAASPNRLFLFGRAGELIEILGAVHGVPGQIEALAQGAGNSLLIRSVEGVYQADLENLDFAQLDQSETQLNWSQPVRLGPDLSARVRNNYGDVLVSWERLILDIHSGRIIGQWGVVLIDVMAILFLTMAVTGVWIWSRRRSGEQSR